MSAARTRHDDMSIVDMLLDDTAAMEAMAMPVSSTAIGDDDDANKMNWDLEDNFLESLMNMENDPASFEFFTNTDELISSTATTPRSYDTAESTSCSDSGLSYVDDMSFIPSGSCNSDSVATNVDLTYDSFVKEEIIEIDDDDDDDNDDDGDNNSGQSKPIFIQQSQILKTVPRTVMISPKQSKGQISISKNVSKPVFIPINLSSVKTIKVVNQNGETINAEAFRRLQSINNGRKIFVRNNGSVVSKTMPILKQNKVLSDSSGDDSLYPRLHLTHEEKKLMDKEGIKLPSHYPLTKHEERDLKRIRRKIRNKISAQDSRKRKKEYVDGLEERVKQCSEENRQLIKSVCALQTENERLRASLKRLQSTVPGGGATVPPATCLLVIIMSLALIAAPNFRPVADEKDVIMSVEGQESNTAVTGRSRNLLFSKSGSPLCNTDLKDALEKVVNASSVDGRFDTIMAELSELLDFNDLACNKDHDYSRTVEKTVMDDYYIPESDDGWTKGVKRSAPSEWINELRMPSLKNSREAEHVILVSNDEESY